MTDTKYKAEEDAERAFYLMHFCHLSRDYPQTAALAASFLRELAAMNARQVERDAKDTADRLKAAAAAASAAAASESDESPPTRSRAR
jgi:hypothetical protein